MQVVLAMFKSDSSRRDFPVKPDGFVIGRKNTCDLRIPLSSVSRKHCELKVVDGQVLLRDAGSSNGTYHNNIRVTEAVLAAGDELVVGPVVFTVVIDGQPEQLKPVRSLVETPGDMQGSSLVLPSDLMELHDNPTGDTLHDGSADPDDGTVDIDDLVADELNGHSDDDDEDEDPIAALDRLADLDLPDSEAQG